MLEIRGASHDIAVRRTFEGPISAALRARDPHHTGNPAWVKYNEPFYERRVALPLVGAAVYPLAGDRSLLYLSLGGYVAAILALFGLLLLRFRVAIAAVVTVAAIFLPPLTAHSSFPLTDSWGLTLEIIALAAAMLTLERGLRWIPLWIVAIAVLAFTRDSTWIPVLGAGWCALRYRSRVPITLFATGIVAALPALLLFKAPVRDLLALLVNHSEPSGDTSWSFIASHYPRAAARARARERRIPPSRRVVHGVLPRRRGARAVPDRVAAPDQQPFDHLDHGRRRCRPRVCALCSGVQRVPTRARIRAHGCVRACPRWRGRRLAGGRARQRAGTARRANPREGATILISRGGSGRSGETAGDALPARAPFDVRRYPAHGQAEPELRVVAAICVARDKERFRREQPDSERARDDELHPALLAMDSIVAARCARDLRRRRGPRTAQWLGSPRHRHAGPGRPVERPGRVAPRRGQHGAPAERQGARVGRLGRRPELREALGPRLPDIPAGSLRAKSLLRWGRCSGGRADS